jgi:uncharacterized protein with NAD-binding domain and iron-sulfur cluster
MAGLSAAWRLSEPGWRNRFDSITVYQRGWRLGGKAASSRGQNGRIEEHGLHVWLGSYENAFFLLRQCYAELDRATTNPQAPIRSWEQALIPSDNLALADRTQDDWSVWLGRFAHNDELPGEPDATVPDLTVVGFLRRALQLILDFADSLGETPPTALVLSTSPEPPADVRLIELVRRGVTAALAALTEPSQRAESGLLTPVLNAIRIGLDDDQRPDRKRAWLLLSLVTATVRGLISDNLVTNPLGFRAINDEDFSDWILRHGAHPDVLEFPLVHGLYDMVFGYRDGERSRPAFAAGLAVMWTGNMLFGYKGALFWKMTAGMGDVVIAPLYQILRRRGVRFEFFHRLDALHLDPTHRTIEAITMGRQLRLADGVDQYAPLVEVRGLPVFPNSPVATQIDPHTDIGCLESHFGKQDDVETRVLRGGVDFDHVVLAVSLGMVPIVAGELIADRPDWREMTAHVRTVATQAFQIWLRPDEASLGCNTPGATVSAYVPPFDTWASMPQTLWAEDWPHAEQPGSVAYFCGSLDAPWPTTDDASHYVNRFTEQVRGAAVKFLDHHVGLYFPKAVTEQGFAWDLLSGVNGRRGREALATQYVSVNIDPSDRYVQSLPGSDRYRLRPDESGYDNLVLAGDWTDCGLNAGCIEAAVMSGLQAANALLGRHRYHRIRGFYLP